MPDDNHFHRLSSLLRISKRDAIKFVDGPPYGIDHLVMLSQDELHRTYRDLTDMQRHFEDHVWVLYHFAIKTMSNTEDQEVIRKAKNFIGTLRFIREYMWQDNDAKFEAVTEAFFLGASFAEIGNAKDLAEFCETGKWNVLSPLRSIVDTAISKANRDKATARQNTRASLLQDALNFVTLDLDGNCHPEWEHVDYVNTIIKKPRFNEKDKNGNYLLSENSLRAEIKRLFRERFKEHGSDYRIAKGQARHIHRPANRPIR